MGSSAHSRAGCLIGPPPARGTFSSALLDADPLEVSVSAPTLSRRQLFHSCGRLGLAGMFFRPLPPARSDPAPAANENDAPEQVALDHQGVDRCVLVSASTRRRNERVLDRRLLITHGGSARPHRAPHP